MSDSVQRQAGASFFIPEANLGMIQAGIAAFEEARRTGAASKDNGDANVVYAVYEAMREKPDQIL